MAAAPKPAPAPEPDPLDDEKAREIERVVKWRLRELLRADYPWELASQIAERQDIDLHEATDMVEAGCDYKTAGEILL